VESELIHSPLFTQNSEDGATKKKKEEGRTCCGFEVVLLAVADRRTAWTVIGLSSSSLCFFFFCSVLLCFCFFSVSSFVSHGAGLLSMTGRMVAAGGCFRVALVAAIQTVTGGSSSFLSFFVFTSKTWQWRWWWCCCSSCPCVLPLSTTSSSLYHGCAADSSRCWWQ